ncbi:MAG: hypothetical protein LBK54_01775 [Propionibacteriaceae bacterium]|jgi:phosphopantothenate-cysteine ligase|nr:hypothetical protein [Propionibacteriaceae bacterium]
MRVLVTGGGTSEAIDRVRRVTNNASGRLGALLADRFAAQPGVSQVVHLCAVDSVRPQSSGVEVETVTTVAELAQAVRRRLTGATVDVVVHSMAVSDYRVERVTTAADLAQALVGQDDPEAIRRAILAVPGLDASHKVSSAHDDLVVILRPALKVISLFKELAPEAQLVGFKLLDQVPLEQLLEQARRLMEVNGCDWVLANDLSQIGPDRHVGHLLDRSGRVQRFESKPAIAEGIVRAVVESRSQTGSVPALDDPVGRRS